MIGGLLQGRCKAQDLLGSSVWLTLNGNEARIAPRQGTGLVEKQDVGLSEPLQRTASFHQHPSARAAGHAGNDRHRHRQNQWARRCDDQYRQQPNRVAGKKPGRACHGQRQRYEQQGITVRQPGDRATRCLCRGNQPDNPGKRAIGSTGARHHVKRRTGIDRPTAHGVAGQPPSGQTLSGQGGLVQLCRAAQGTVNRYHFTAAHQQSVARHHLIKADLPQLTVFIAVSQAWGSVQQCRHFTASLRLGVIFQGPPAGHHQANDRCREDFVQRQRQADRQQGQHINPGLTTQQGFDDINGKPQQDRQHPRQPQPMRQCNLRVQVEQPAGQQRDSGHYQQGPIGQLRHERHSGHVTIATVDELAPCRSATPGADDRSCRRSHTVESTSRVPPVRHAPLVQPGQSMLGIRPKRVDATDQA